MADLTVTFSLVKESADAQTISGTASDATPISAGDPVYQDTDGTYKRADASASATAAAIGIAATSSADDQPVVIYTAGDIAFGSILTVGERYFVSVNTGKIMPSGDLASTDYVTLLGVAISTSVMRLNLLTSGAQVP